MCGSKRSLSETKGKGAKAGQSRNSGRYRLLVVLGGCVGEALTPASGFAQLCRLKSVCPGASRGGLPAE